MVTVRLKLPIKRPELRTWVALNEAMQDADDELCRELLAEESVGRRRKRFMLRIHSRLNRMRAGAERIKIREEAED